MASRKQQSRKQQSRKQHTKTVKASRPADSSTETVSAGSVKVASRSVPAQKSSRPASPKPSSRPGSTSVRARSGESSPGKLSDHDRKLVVLAALATLFASLGGILLPINETIGFVLGLVGVVGIMVVTWLSTRDPESEERSRSVR